MNTLAFADFGGALPLVLLLNARGDALSLIANSEAITASLLGVGAASVGLIIAVPATALAATWLVGARPSPPRMKR